MSEVPEWAGAFFLFVILTRFVTLPGTYWVRTGRWKWTPWR